MVYVILALVLFVACSALHILYCRKAAKDMLHAKVFMMIAIGGLGAYAAAAAAVFKQPAVDPYSIWGLPLMVTGGAVFVLLIPAYLVFYVLTKLVSPSQKILSAASQSTGASYEDIVAAVREEKFLDTRLKDLVTSGCVVCKDNVYRITASGQTVSATLRAMQAILGREAGG